MNRDLHSIASKAISRAVLSVMMILALVSCDQKNGAPATSLESNASPMGILPFETASDSVVLRSSLTSAASITAAGGFEETGSVNEFDGSLGMKPRAAPGVVPGCRFTGSSVPALTNIPSGQLSIEVEREWLASENGEARSMGYNHTDNEHLLSYGPGGASTAGLLYMQPDQRLTWFFKASEILRGAHYVSTNRSERFARITLSWTPVEARLYVDGLLMGIIDRTDQGSDRFSTIYVGNFIGSALYGFMGNYFVRNLIVARTPVVFQVPPLVEHVMQIGDSFSAGVPLVSVFAKYDGTISNTIIGQLAQRGIGYRKYTVYSHGGGNVQDNGPKALEADVSGSGKTRAEALTENPTLVIFITAGNDRGIFDETRYMTDLRDHVEAFLGENGHMATTVKQVIVTTIASNLLATDPAILSMNQIMRSLPGWWDSTYPHKAGSVSVVDMWDIFGGANVDHSLFGISDPVHPAANGNIVYGRTIAGRILAFSETGYNK